MTEQIIKIEVDTELISEIIKSVMVDVCDEIEYLVENDNIEGIKEYINNIKEMCGDKL